MSGSSSSSSLSLSSSRSGGGSSRPSSSTSSSSSASESLSCTSFPKSCQWSSITGSMSTASSSSSGGLCSTARRVSSDKELLISLLTIVVVVSPGVLHVDVGITILYGEVIVGLRTGTKDVLLRWKIVQVERRWLGYTPESAVFEFLLTGDRPVAIRVKPLADVNTARAATPKAKALNKAKASKENAHVKVEGGGGEGSLPKPKKHVKSAKDAKDVKAKDAKEVDLDALKADNAAFTRKYEYFQKELFKRYEVEEGNTLAIVEAQRENEAQAEKIAEAQAEIARLKAEVASGRLEKGSAVDGDEDEDADESESESAKEIARLRAENARLKQQQPSAPSDQDKTHITDPADGTRLIARMRFNAQNPEDKLQYNAILRSVQEIVIQVQMPWHKDWRQIPSQFKTDAYTLARTRQPYLARFEDDWATQEIICQYIHNRKTTAYRKGLLARPEKYKHCKANAAKRDQTKPRGHGGRILTVAAAKKAAKGKGKAGAKGKKSRMVVVDSEEEADETEADEEDEEEQDE
ncbi:hypothetical protein C8F01DRAFT_1087923 [Mycena amicta]|nr:hypothetical protein C8F01DRAFT_1087923 [Mycena amicta]